MNIIVSENGPQSSTIVVNTRYVVTINVDVTDAQGRHQVVMASTQFNTGEAGKTQYGTICRANGQFERDVLSLIS